MKKFSLSIIAIALTFNLMATNIWDGSTESWTAGDGTMSNPYRIETAAHLAFLAEKVNEGYQSLEQGVFEGEYFFLTDDLDLNNLNWTPIGNVDYNMNGFYFAGYFDGGYHQIENLRIETSADLAGLFSSLAGDAYVRNLSVNGTVISTGMGASGVVGGIAGEALVYRCSFSGSVSITNNGSYCGAAGVVAGATQNGRVVQCSSSANVTATNSSFLGAAVAGGVVSFVRENVFVQHCYNTGSVSANAILMGIAAGILGATVETANATVDACYNVGQISGITAGAIFGMVSPIDPRKAENEVMVTNSYFLNSAGGNNGYGTSMTADEMRTEGFKNQLNEGSHAFVMDNGTNNGFPIHGLASFILFEASDITPHSAKISAWIHEGNDHFARAYFLYKVWDAEEWIEVDVATDGYVEAVLEDLEEETYYEFGMECEFVDGGWLAWGPPKAFLTGYDMVGETIHDVMVYPNPTSDRLYIQGLEPIEVQVYNALGQLLKIAENTTVINMSDMAAGVYVLRITDADGKVFERKVSVK